VVGEIGPGVVAGGGADGDGSFDTGWRVVAGVAVIVSGGDGKVESLIDGVRDGCVEGAGFAASEGHVGYRTLVGTALLSAEGQMFLDREIHTGNDVRHGARSIRPQDLDGDHLSLLGDTIGSTTNGTSTVGTMSISISIRVAIGDGRTPGSAALKLVMVDRNASVDDKDGNAVAAFGIVDVLAAVLEGVLTVRNAG